MWHRINVMSGLSQWDLFKWKKLLEEGYNYTISFLFQGLNGYQKNCFGLTMNRLSLSYSLSCGFIFPTLLFYFICHFGTLVTSVLAVWNWLRKITKKGTWRLRRLCVCGKSSDSFVFFFNYGNWIWSTCLFVFSLSFFK